MFAIIFSPDAIANNLSELDPGVKFTTLYTDKLWFFPTSTPSDVASCPVPSTLCHFEIGKVTVVNTSQLELVHKMVEWWQDQAVLPVSSLSLAVAFSLSAMV
jgi:hypothetical protein